jgi:hypothetical protein
MSISVKSSPNVTARESHPEFEFQAGDKHLVRLGAKPPELSPAQADLVWVPSKDLGAHQEYTLMERSIVGESLNSPAPNAPEGFEYVKTGEQKIAPPLPIYELRDANPADGDFFAQE